MPKITQQSPTQMPNPDSHDILNRIKKLTARTDYKIMMSLYGQPKTGKTRLACTFPKPLLIIGAEDGTASVEGMDGIEFAGLLRCEEIIRLYPLIETGRWKTVVLDSGTKLRDMRISEILGLGQIALQKGWGFAAREQWTECSNSLKGLLWPLMVIGKNRKCNLVIIAQEQNYAEEGNISSDLIRPTVGPALGKSVCDWINAECDQIGTMYKKEEVATSNVDVGGVLTPISTRTGRCSYCLKIGPDSVYQTGFRLSNGRVLKQEDEVIVDPNYEKILKIVKG